MRLLLCMAVSLAWLAGGPSLAKDASGLKIEWAKNLLTVRSSDLPGGSIEIWYLEAFCRSGSTKRVWSETTIPHQTTLKSASPDGRQIRLETRVAGSVRVEHLIQANADELVFDLTLTNEGEEAVDVAWFQPCIRVGGFTGRSQEDYVPKCFIFTERGLTTLDKTRRTEEAIYRGGQVYVPKGVDLNDVNPRPISPDRPVNGLIGCFSADGKQLLATAWSDTQELFQGVIVCLHNDPRVAGLNAGETKRLRGKLYLLENDPEELLRRYSSDFGPPVGQPR